MSTRKYDCFRFLIVVSMIALGASIFSTAHCEEQPGEGAPGSYIEDESQDRQAPSLQGRADLNVDNQSGTDSSTSSGTMPPLAPPVSNSFNKPGPSVEQSVRRGGVLKNLFDLSADHSEKRMQRPSWLPAHAYSNDSMVAPYHNREYFWWDKSPMPDKPQWVVLSTSVTRFWRGYAPQPCWVLVSPNPLAPGNFTFRARVANGPRGWLQALPSKSRYGFPLYRYWLDQP